MTRDILPKTSSRRRSFVLFHALTRGQQRLTEAALSYLSRRGRVSVLPPWGNIIQQGSTTSYGAPWGRRSPRASAIMLTSPRIRAERLETGLRDRESV